MKRPTKIGLFLAAALLASSVSAQLMYNNTFPFWNVNGPLTVVGATSLTGVTTQTGALNITGTTTITGNTIIATTASPAAADACTAGRIVWDTSYLYVCTATGVWKRAAVTGSY